MSSTMAGLRFRLFRPTAPAASTDALAEALRAGDAAAVGQVYAEHHAQVRAFARRLVGEDAAAEDLVHDVFVALPGAMAGFRGESALLTFLLSIAVNQARNHVRTAVRRRRTMEAYGREPLGESSEGPESEVARRQLAEALTAALDTLPLEQRAVVVLCDVEGRSSSEAAAILEVPDGTVRTRLFHARRKLREWFEKEKKR